jgi:hypothetical protein
MKTEKMLILMRGIPGSGKSYTARSICVQRKLDPYLHIFSTDHFFCKDVMEQRRSVEGNPDYDPAFWDELEIETYRSNWCYEDLACAHGWNHCRVDAALRDGLALVIVDNTNTKAKEMKRYAKMGEEAGYKILVQEPTSQWWIDHQHMLRDKQKFGRELEDFARFLAGFHQGMEAKYGAKGNQHGVPLQVIRNMIRGWECDLTIDDIMGRTDRKF